MNLSPSPPSALWSVQSPFYRRHRSDFLWATRDFLMRVQSSRMSASCSMYTMYGPVTVTGFLRLQQGMGARSLERLVTLISASSRAPILSRNHKPPGERTFILLHHTLIFIPHATFLCVFPAFYITSSLSNFSDFTFF
jgi:hypothetical protein